MAKNIAASRQKKPSGLSDKVSDIVLVVICAAIMLIVAYPLYYVLVASFSDPYDVYAGKTFLLPSQFTLKGYQAVFADSALFSGFMNSIKYTVIGTIYSVVMIYLVAYPLSVKDLPGRKYISLFFVITMYFGGGLVPTYLIVKQTGLLGSMWALFLPGVVAVGNVIIVRNFFENNIPRELLEAAEIDGCSKAKTLIRVILPVSIPSLISTGLYAFINAWNEFMFGYVLISSDKLRTLTPAIMLFKGANLVDWGGLMAASVISVLPVTIIFLFLQKYFLAGLMSGSVKG